MLFIFLRIPSFIPVFFKIRPTPPPKVMVIQTYERIEIWFLFWVIRYRASRELWNMCHGYAWELGIWGVVPKHMVERSQPQTRGQGRLRPERRSLQIHQVKTQVLWEPRCGPEWEAGPASLRSLQYTILSRRIDHGHETGYMTVYVLIYVLPRKERLSPAQISNIYLVLKSCHSLHFLSGLRKSTFVRVISQITRPNMGKNMEGHFERDDSLGWCLFTYWLSINTLLPCNYFHNGFLKFWFLLMTFIAWNPWL